MKFNLDETILVTHKNCLDGAGCAIAFCLAGGKRENIIFVNAGRLDQFIKSNPAFTSNKFLLIVDLSINDENDISSLEKRGNLLFIDHHKSSASLQKYDWAIIDIENTRCGVIMLRDYFVQEHNHRFMIIADVFFNAIDDNDRWIQRNFFSKKFVLLMDFFGQEDFISRMLNGRLRELSVNHLYKFLNVFEIEIVNILERKESEAISNALSKVILTTMFTADDEEVTVAGIVSSEQNVSLLLNRLLEKYDNADVAICISIDRGSASLRSRKDSSFDVTKIASLYGGGGHVNAAGHSLPVNIKEHIFKDIYDI